MTSKKIILGSDHAGYDLKLKVQQHLEGKGYECTVLGATSTESFDYPATALEVAELVVAKNIPGILMCGTGLGEGIVANKVKGIRATVCTNEYMAKMAREHNDSNILCLGSRVLSLEDALKIVDVWITANVSKEERHLRRIKQIKDIDEQRCK